MIRAAIYSLSALALLSFAGCRASLPDAYGIYANTDHGRILLPGQPVQAVGNMMSYFPGLIGPSGLECDSLKDFTVYQKDLDPATVGLVQLHFLKEGTVSALGFGGTRVRVNLWVPDQKHIDVEVKPVEERRDMYFVAPRRPLEKGFYALYIKQFGVEIGSESRVYDLVIGSARDFPAYTSALATNQNEIEKAAPALLEKMNQLLNEGKYQSLGEVYRPNGRILSGTELQTFAAGNQTWLSTAGKILKSEVVSAKAVDEDSAHCEVKTTYEKAGVQQESMTFRKIENSYFITAIQ